MDLRSFIRDVPDFPKPGIMFKDISPLLADPAAFEMVIKEFRDRLSGAAATHVVGIESRGFIFGAPLARELGLPFVLARKPGKLPAATVSQSYALEYGEDAIEIHQDALSSADRVLIVDDVIATGGTAAATGALVQKLGAKVAAYAFLIELGFLNGREKIGDEVIISLLDY